jgi:replication factor C large subunit
MEELWTEKHKPKTIKEIVGQDEALKQMQDFLKSWKPGEALLISGPAGVGKTLAVEVIARETGLFLIQLNASDERSASKIEEFLKECSKSRSLFSKGKIILLDEVDGISGHERGASNAIIKIIEESKFPVIMIANDPWSPKLRSLKTHSKEVKFRKIHMYDIMKRLKSIADSEGIKLEDNSLRSLAKWSSGDMRSAVLDLQAARTDKKTLAEKDLEVLGYRERESNVFSVLPIIFHSKNIKAARKAMQESDKDTDELLYWIENNIYQEMMTPDAVSEAFDLLSKADLFRNRAGFTQNWRFKAYMADLLAGISLLRPDIKHAGFVPYRPPDRFMIIGRTKAKRALIDSGCKKIGKTLHCSARVVKKEYLPYLRIILKKGKQQTIFENLGLEDEELEAIKGKWQ